MYLQLLFCPNTLKERSNLVCFLDFIVLERDFLINLCWVTGRVCAKLKIQHFRKQPTHKFCCLDRNSVQGQRGKGRENMIRCRSSSNKFEALSHQQEIISAKKTLEFFRKVGKFYLQVCLVYTSKNLQYSSKFLDGIQNKKSAEKVFIKKNM